MYVTKETLDQMRAELQHMKAVERPAASKAIAEAREKGDLQKISVTSPIGKGLLGKKVGDDAEIQTPNGKIFFQIDNISI